MEVFLEALITPVEGLRYPQRGHAPPFADPCRTICWGYCTVGGTPADNSVTGHGLVFGVYGSLVLLVRCADGHSSRASPDLRWLFFFPVSSDILLLGAFSPLLCGVPFSGIAVC